ncbi:short-chain dehydrogenase/reductase SDR [Hyaloraphidium curvatum]|nr:short-chain dehydrogenase/reductase SDR [Hyaloraphidium curvatum]
MPGTRMLNSDGRSRVVLITGASKGMGKSHALALAREGATVVVTDIPSQSAAGRQVVDEINSKGGRAAFLELDVTNEEDWQRAAAEVEKAFGVLDVLINNAGAAFPEEAPEALNFGPNGAWRRTMSLNLDGVAMGTKYGIQLMKKNKSKDRKSIINVSSTAGLKGIIGSYAYGAAKGGVTIFSKSVAVYAARHGINVNSIHPGAVVTDFHKAVAIGNASAEESATRFAARAMIRDPARPEDVSGIVVYLSSPEAGFATGGSYVIDGGLANL